MSMINVRDNTGARIFLFIVLKNITSLYGFLLFWIQFIPRLQTLWPRTNQEVIGIARAPQGGLNR